MQEGIVASKAELSSLVKSSREKYDSVKLLSSLSDSSAQDFISRLKSYRKWSSKPVEVSPWWCSRYGWYCVEKDLLQCVGCRHYLSAHLPSPVEDAVLHKKAVDRLRGRLTEAHDIACSWRSDITSEETCAPNVSDYDLGSIDFANRLRSLLDFFPAGHEKRYLVSASGFDEKVSEEDLNALMTSVKASDLLGQEDMSKDAFVVAILGWRVDRTCKECICCDYCLRRIGLWLFHPPAQSETEESSALGNLENVQRPSLKMVKHLDPVGQHHKWCPWVMAVPSSSALFMNSSELGEMACIPTWLAFFRLLSIRGSTEETRGASFGKDKISEHYVLGRQLLDETLEYIEADSGHPDLASVGEEENIII